MSSQNEYQHHSIWTPELVEISIPLAGVGRRVMAKLLDQVIVTLALGMLWGVFVTFWMIVGGLFQTGGLGFIVTLVLFSVFSVFSYLLYFWLFPAFNHGRTIGKALMGIRLVTDRGGKVGVWTCFVRALFDILDFMLFEGGISLIMMLVNDQEKRIADYAAGTLVILDSKSPN